jgi:parallel beta-helix repeat protein
MKWPLPYKMTSRSARLAAWAAVPTGLMSLLLGQNAPSHLILAPVAAQSIAQSTAPAFKVRVNSNQDGAIQANASLTLREAIALINGQLLPSALSAPELAQVEPLSGESSQIEFQLPDNQTTIQLETLLPIITAPGLTIDGTTQAGYAANPARAKPLIAITPAVKSGVTQGFNIRASRVTVRGLSFYGFSSASRQTAIAADIVIGDSYTQHKDDATLTDIVIEKNWLGTATGEAPAPASGFGVVVTDALNTRIADNWIAFHDSSGILTGDRVENTQIVRNTLQGNGQTGLPDGIRLEGELGGIKISDNKIIENAGSAIYCFKSQGGVEIRNNKIANNGYRVSQAAIYLMGSGHKVIENQIQNQSGPGVVVAAYPQSVRNQILGNWFLGLSGLSIDLVTRHSTQTFNYAQGDGVNPRRDSGNRRLDTGNAAINAPQFLSSEFYLIEGQVRLDGVADAGSTIVLYQVAESDQTHGPLNKPMMETQADAKGRFSFSLTDVAPGVRFSAIATHPEYGTSEPAANTEVRTIGAKRSLN